MSLEAEFRVDTLSITFEVEEFSVLFGNIDLTEVDRGEACDVLGQFVSNYLGVGFSHPVFGDAGRNGFDDSVSLGDCKSFFSWGGNNTVRNFGEVTRRTNERCQLYLTGDGCSKVLCFNRFAGVLRRLTTLRITRLDIAADFHGGEMTVLDARAMFEAGEFKSRGRPPKANYIDDMGSNKGCTFYVGNRAYGKLFRAYDKGKQLGSESSPWVRYEVEWSNKDREIPIDALERPQEFIAGSYPAMGFLSEVIQVIRTCREKLRITYTELCKWSKHQYGKLFNFQSTILGLEPDEILDLITNPDGIPRRMTGSFTDKNGELLCL